MLDQTCPVQWMGQQALVTLPKHIYSGNADQIREQLLWIINRGAAVLIADLTGTFSCDFSGADALARAHRRAVANGAELRLVVTAGVVRRVLARNGLDRLVAIYPDLDGALAAADQRLEVHSYCRGTWRKRRMPRNPPRPIPQRCCSGGLTFSAIPPASTTQLTSNGGGLSPIRQRK